MSPAGPCTGIAIKVNCAAFTEPDCLNLYGPANMSESADNRLSALSNVRVVLVHTSHPGNIGGTARAMKNMGLDQLVLVQPKRYPHEDAVWRAAGAVDVLDKIRIVDTLEEAVADCSLVVGTSARGRRIPWPLTEPRDCGERLVSEASAHQVAMVFGREDRGLTNEELQICNLHVHIPTNPEYSSLNLAMAVQVLSYELRLAALSASGKTGSETMNDWDRPLATVEDMQRFFVHLEETLVQIGFLKPKAPKQLMTRLKRLFHRVRMDDMEMNILRGILTATQAAEQAEPGASRGERSRRKGPESE